VRLCDCPPTNSPLATRDGLESTCPAQHGGCRFVARALELTESNLRGNQADDQRFNRPTKSRLGGTSLGARSHWAARIRDYFSKKQSTMLPLGCSESASVNVNSFNWPSASRCTV
jgi:hypothetical protein